MANIYWVSPTGTAIWTAAESDTPLLGTACASLATANSSAVAGDTINFRAGTYTTGIQPVNSGTSGNVILWQAYSSETVVIASTGVSGIELDPASYHRFYDLEIDGTNSTYQFRFRNGSHYNELDSCYLHDDGSDTASAGYIATIIVGHAASTGVDDNTHNWVHHCTFERGGKVVACSDNGGLLDIGADNTFDSVSNNNTVEDNVFITGAHHVVKTKSKNNLIRRNVISNPENHFVAEASCQVANPTDSGFYGNRCLTILDHSQFNDGYNVVEGNRIGHAGIPADGNGGYCMTIGAAKTIVRYNEFYGASETGVYFRSSSNNADDIMFYNNTVWNTGLVVSRSSPGTTRHGIRVQNNANGCHAINNVITDAVDVDLRDETSGNLIERGNFVTSDGDPQFTNTTWPGVDAALSTTEPDLIPQSSSPLIDNGSYLTQANGSDTSSVTLIVDNSYFFQSGGRGSDLSPSLADWISIGTIDNSHQILSISYATHTITLATSTSWSDGDPIWLFKNSSGEQVLFGTAPDQGANQLNLSATVPSMSAIRRKSALI